MDNANFPVAAFNPEEMAAIPAETRQAFGAVMAKYGFDQGAVDRALSGAPAEPAAKLPVKTGADALTSEQRQAMADNLTKHWTGDPKVLEDALRANGLGNVDDAPDTRSEAQKSFDEHFGGLEPDQYDLRGLFTGRQLANVPNPAVAPKDAQEWDADLRAALSSMKIPALIGKGLASAMLDAASSGWAHQQSPAAQELFYRQQSAVASRAAGKPYSEVVELARRAVDQIPRETALKLAAAGAFDRAAVMVQLARQGERLKAREAML